MGDIQRGKGVDEEKLQDVAPTWRPLYRQKVVWILAQEEMAQGMIRLPRQSMPERWKLKDIQEAWAALEGVEDCESELVWKGLQGARLPLYVKQMARQILWKKMPVMTRLKDKGMAETDKCPLCGNREDHDHLIKKCAQLQEPPRILRMAFEPVTIHGTRIEIWRSQHCL